MPATAWAGTVYSPTVISNLLNGNLMKNRIMYIEHKTNQNDKGKAWIGYAEFSKSGKTVYFNNMAFKKNTGYADANTDYANYFDIETDEAYWISGVKKNGQDRHWAGSGKIFIEKSIIDEYLSIVDLNSLDKIKFEVIEVLKTDKQRFVLIENQCSI